MQARSAQAWLPATGTEREIAPQISFDLSRFRAPARAGSGRAEDASEVRSGLVAGGDDAEIDGLVVEGGVDAVAQGHVAQRLAGLRGVLDDRGGEVVADRLVEGGGDGEGAAGGGVAAGLV